MIDGGLVYAVVKAIVQYAHGIEYSCKEYSMRVLSALVNAPGYPGSASAPGQGGSIAAAAIFSEVSDSDRSKSLCQAIIIILDEASVFNDGMTVEDQRLRLILPVYRGRLHTIRTLDIPSSPLAVAWRMWRTNSW